MFHLFLVAADLVCGGHEAGTATMASMQMPDGPHHTGHQSAPEQLRCCDAMSSCGVSAIASLERTLSFELFCDDVPTTATVLIASAVPSPEPPPPKV